MKKLIPPVEQQSHETADDQSKSTLSPEGQGTVTYSTATDDAEHVPVEAPKNASPSSLLVQNLDSQLVSIKAKILTAAGGEAFNASEPGDTDPLLVNLLLCINSSDDPMPDSFTPRSVTSAFNLLSTFIRSPRTDDHNFLIPLCVSLLDALTVVDASTPIPFPLFKIRTVLSHLKTIL